MIPFGSGTDTGTDGRRTTRANNPAGRASRTGGTGTGVASRRRRRRRRRTATSITNTSTGGTDISWSSPRDSGAKCSGGRPRAGRSYRRLRWSGRGRVTRTAGWSPRARYLIIRRRTVGGNIGNTGERFLISFFPFFKCVRTHFFRSEENVFDVDTRYVPVIEL